MEPASILIVDDHALFRSGLAAILAAIFPTTQIQESESLDHTLGSDAPSPTIVLLDIQLHGISGLEGMASLRRKWPAARIVVVSALATSAVVEEALGRGAAAFLSKADPPAHMTAVLRDLCARSQPGPGGRALGEAIPRGTLTPRQNEVLDLVCQGLSNKMIGRRLGLSEHTVRGHVQAMLGVLGVSNRAEAAFQARRLGLIR